MRRIVFVVLALAVLAGAVLGFVKTGFFSKAVWVFEPATKTEPDLSEDGLRNQSGSTDRTDERPGAHVGKPGELKGGLQGPYNPSGFGIYLVNVGYFALILTFFAMGTCLIARFAKRRPMQERVAKQRQL